MPKFSLTHDDSPVKIFFFFRKANEEDKYIQSNFPWKKILNFQETWLGLSEGKGSLSPRGISGWIEHSTDLWNLK